MPSRSCVAEAQKSWPPGITLTYRRDKSVYVREDISQLVNDVVVAVMLVVICLIGILGLQNALLAGIIDSRLVLPPPSCCSASSA